MNDDILPELLQEVQERFEDSFGKSKVIDTAFSELKAKKATYKTVNDFAIELGEILADALGVSVTGDKLPDGKMYYNIGKRLLEDVLGRNYDYVSGYASDVQQILNEQANIRLKVQVPELNQDRIDGLVNRLSSEDDFDKVAWILQEPIVNFTQSIVDDSIRANAEFHKKAGLTPTISRQSTGKCCKWCDSLVGEYIYHEEPKDFYRRHQNCRCTIDYHPKNGKYQNSWSKKWSKETDDDRERRKQIGKDIRDNNRKEDIAEYKKIVATLGYQNSPISLAKFQDLKYNDGEGYQELKDRVTWTNSKFPTEKSIKGHFKDHGGEFGVRTAEEYQQLAADLLSRPKTDMVLGYETPTRRVRYDKETGAIAIGKINPSGGVKITTMFKPDNGEEYYHDDYEREHHHD